MADKTPTPLSYPQILGREINTLTTEVGISRLKVGGPLLSELEASSRALTRNSQDVFNLIRSQGLDTAEGVALDRIGRGEDISRLLQSRATGTVSINDTSFNKISDVISTSTPAPITGSLSINIEEGSAFPASGSVYLGRNTPSVEGPLPYSSIVDNGSYWTITLTSPTVNFHNWGESVILAQGGNRSITAGQIVSTQQSSLAAKVQFSTIFNEELSDGETEIVGIQVVATEPGAQGNVSANSITSFPGGTPFPGAVVNNPLPFITGRDTETDSDYKDRIRRIRNSRQRGTDLAIEESVLGITATDENRRVTSANLVRVRNNPDILYIDDGSGYEEISEGFGEEIIIDLATGGEYRFKTTERPIAQAFVESDNDAPYPLEDGQSLSVSVGGILYTHYFDVSDFVSIKSATAYEVTSSINSNPNVKFNARTSNAGTKVVLFSRTEENDNLEVSDSSTSNIAFQFPLSPRYTTLLYKNDRLLNKDGLVAKLTSNNISLWNAFSGNQTLITSVDGTPSVTTTFTDQDFIDLDTGFLTIGKNSLEAWAKVINYKVPGITCAVELDKLTIISNRGASNDASISITGGTLVSELMWAVDESIGFSRDYTIDRSTSDIVLETPLGAGDRLTMGSEWTRAFIESDDISATDIGVDRKQYWAIDADPQIIPHGVGAATSLTASIVGSTNSGFTVKITATSLVDTFLNVQPEDWMVLYDLDTDLPDTLRNAWKVIETTDEGGLQNGLTFEKRAMNVPRGGHAITTMAFTGGDISPVMAIGGYTHDTGAHSINTRSRHGNGITSTCEIFDFNTNEWTYTGSLATPRVHHTATLLGDDRILVCGGLGPDGNPLISTEIYDPGTGTWSAGPNMDVVRAWHTATLLPSGRVLIAGGWLGGSAATDSSIEFNPGTNTFINSSTMVTARFAHGGILVTGGLAEGDNVFVAGGQGGLPTNVLEESEMYDTGTFTWGAKANMGGDGRRMFGLQMLNADQYILAVGDGDPILVGPEEQHSYQVYDTVGDTWTSNVDMPNEWNWECNRDLLKISATEVLAPYGINRDSDFSLVHIKFTFNGGSPTVPTITSTANSNFFNSGLKKSLFGGVTLQNVPGDETVFICGGSSIENLGTNTGITTSNHEQYNDPSNSWTYPDSSLDLSTGTLQNRGLVFVRTDNFIHQITIPAGLSYTAPTISDAIDLPGLTSSVYKTNRIRVSTNSFNQEGDLLLVATDADEISLDSEVVVDNLLGHLGSVESGNSELGTPHSFRLFNPLYVTPGHVLDAEETIYINPDFDAPASGHFVGLRRQSDGVRPTNWEGVAPTEIRNNQVGQSLNFKNPIATHEILPGIDTNTPDSIRLGLRDSFETNVSPHQYGWFALPYAFSPNDDLTIIMDSDTETGRYVIPMVRDITPTSTTFGSQNPFTDAETIVTIGASFGLTYDFNDFAIYMQARTKTNGADVNKRAIWRYYRHGKEGENMSLRYMYPESPDSDVDTTVTYDQDGTSQFTKALNGNEPYLGHIQIFLNSGAAKEASVLRNSGSLALARTNGADQVFDNYIMAGYEVVESERTSTVSVTGNRLTVQVPNNGVVAEGPQDSGINVGDTLWFEATNPSATTLFSGTFTVTQVDAFNVGTGQQDIYFDGAELNNGAATYGPSANTGTVSFDTLGESSFDPSIAVNDYVRLEDGFSSQWANFTMRVISSDRQHIICRAPDINDVGAVTTPVIEDIDNTDDVVIFGGSTLTATQLVDAVNVLASTDTTTTPISGVITGTGTDIIFQATWDELDNIAEYYRLTDGLNFVQRTIDPPDDLTDTEFLFRLPTSANLASDSDWQNENVKIGPILTEDVVQWFNTLPITGLSTKAEIRASNDGTNVQISSLTIGEEGSVQIQGGSSNFTTGSVQGAAKLALKNPGLADHTILTTILREESNGMVGDGWVEINNNNPLPKSNFFNSFTDINSISSDGTWTFSDFPEVLITTRNYVRAHFEKIGKWATITIPVQINNFIPDINDFFESFYVQIELPGAPPATTINLDDVSTSNQGYFKILKASEDVSGLTLWIDNSNLVEELSVCKINTFSSDSIVPGDLWIVSTNAFGAGNKGTWVVTESDTDHFKVDVSEKPAEVLTTPITLGTNEDSLTVREGFPGKFLKRIISIAPNQNDGAFSDIQLEGSLDFDRISESAGSVLTLQDKLEFPTGIFTGVDGYRFNTGLIGESNRILFGDPADEISYSGYVSAGASINISGPLVKRIQVSLGIRIQSGIRTQDVADRIRNAVAAVINNSPIGKPIAISDIVEAASEIPGVTAVSVILPTYTSSNDIIKVQAFEKPLVLDIKKDVSITFIGI